MNKAFIWIYIKKYLLGREIFINNSTFLDCLHSKGVVLHAHLNLPENMP